jgi:acetylornithine/N-succinyldiaminopimelate aminotransferase
MGVCLATADAAKGLTTGTHGTTFGGNPLAMACGNAVLDILLEPGFIERVERLGLLLRQRLAELKDHHPDVIEEIRGQGLLVGLKLKVPNGEFAAAAREERLLTIPAGDNVVRLLPPLIVTDDELAEGVRRLDRACERVEAAISGVRAGAAE